MDRLSGITVFVEAAEAGGFSAAAERLHLSRSAVGKTVARLEERLGVRLFHRTTRTQSLTAEGQNYYEYCRRALAELRAGEDVLASGRQDVAGRVRVTLPVLLGRRCVAPLLTDLARRHPALELELAFSDRNADLLEEGYDLAVRSGRPGGDGLASRLIAKQRMHLCAAPAYLEARGTPATVVDLAAHDALAYAHAGRLRSWIFPDAPAGMREFAPNARLRFDDLEAIADAAAAGMGLAWLPGWLIRDRVRSGALVRVLPEHASFGFDVHAVWPAAPHLTRRLRAIVDTLADALPPLMQLP